MSLYRVHTWMVYVQDVQWIPSLCVSLAYNQVIRSTFSTQTPLHKSFPANTITEGFLLISTNSSQPSSFFFHTQSPVGCYSRGTGKRRQGTGTKHRSCKCGRNLECFVSTGTDTDADTDNTKQVAQKGRCGILDDSESAIRHRHG